MLGQASSLTEIVADGKLGPAAIAVAFLSGELTQRQIGVEHRLLELAAKLRAGQRVFAATGGLHAAAIFTTSGALLAIREDVGRHNAVDKVVGYALSHAMLPLANHLMMVSGRLSFEIVQKAAAAGVPILAAVSAPSSLAVELAEEVGTTLIGFLRDGSFNVYSRPDRVAV